MEVKERERVVEREEEKEQFNGHEQIANKIVLFLKLLFISES